MAKRDLPHKHDHLVYTFDDWRRHILEYSHQFYHLYTTCIYTFTYGHNYIWSS
jgi:hypothetical protein